MPDFTPLSSQAQDYTARQNDARRADEDDIRRRALDLRKRQTENQSKASTQLQHEVEQDADTFASFLTGESEGTGQSEKTAGSPFDVPGGQEEMESAGDIFSQLLRGQSGAGKKGDGSEVSSGQGDVAHSADGDTARQSDSMDASPFSNPFMGWGSPSTGQQSLESARYAQAGQYADSTEAAEAEGDTESAFASDSAEGSSGTESAGGGSDDSSVSGSSDGEGSSSVSLFGLGGPGMSGVHMAGGAQGRGDSYGGGSQGGGGGSDGFERAAQEAAALNVANLQSSLLNAMQRPGAAGIEGTEDTAGIGGSQAAELIEKLGTEVVERLLVTDPAHQSRQEVRLKIRDSVLKDTEVRVYRDGDEVHVEFVTPSEESAQTLSQNAADLESTLRERLGASGVVVKIDKTDADTEA